MSNTLPFAQRTGWTLTPNKLNNTLEQLRRDKVSILDLTESNPTRCEFSYSKNEIITALSDKTNLSYTPKPKGSHEARDAICRYYKERGITIFPDQVFLTSSTSEAYSYLFRLLADPGDQVLFPRPSYPLFSFLGDLNDIRMGAYPLCYKDHWGIDLKGLRDVFCYDTKALVLVNPNNPTGSFIQTHELEKINTLCEENHAVLICDEVFSDFAFSKSKNYPSLAGNKRVLTFVLGGISKTLGLPQMKLSWIIVDGPQELVEAASARLEVIADTYLSVNTPVQNALPVWLSHRKTIQKEINSRIVENYNFLRESAKTVDKCELLLSEGGWYAVVKISDGACEEEWALTLLNEDHVYIHPGYFFDFDEGSFMVISLLPSKNVFEEGVKRILGRIKECPLVKGL